RLWLDSRAGARGGARRAKRRACQAARRVAIGHGAAVKMIVMRSFLPTSLLAALASCVTLTVAGQTAPPAPLRLVAANSTRTIPTVLNGDTELVAFDDLAALFGVTVREDTVAHAITVSLKGKTIVLSQNQALASISGRLVSLPAPPIRIGPPLYVPVEFFRR